MLNIVMPTIFICLTTFLVFYLRPESWDKLSLSVTILLSLTVFSLLVADSLPLQSDSKHFSNKMFQITNIKHLTITQYFGMSIGLMALSTSMTVVVLHLHHRGCYDHQVPHWVRFIILQGLGKEMFMRKITESNLSAVEKKKVVPCYITNFLQKEIHILNILFIRD